MKNKYIVVCGLVIDAKDDDVAREIVYDACRIAGIQVHIDYVQLEEERETNEQQD
jgi:hypothetical protein